MTARSLAWLVAVLLLGSGLLACGTTCPPGWLASPPKNDSWHYASGSCGLLGLEIRPDRVALSRAARTLAERLGLDVSSQFTVTRVGDHLEVEAYGAAGRSEALVDLEFVESAQCGDRVHVLVRLPRSSTR